MGTRALLVSTTTRWLGPARMPRALANVGFDVLLLTPAGSLAEHSRYIARVEHLPDSATTAQWVSVFTATVAATSPQIVLPCDDMAFRLLQMTVLLPPPANMPPVLHLQASALVRDSLGDPAHYRSSVDKTLLPPAAEALGVRVPPHAIIADAQSAHAFAATHGYPVVLKRSHGSAGEGVAICKNSVELAAAVPRLLRQSAIDVEWESHGRVLAQAHIPGGITYYNIAAWRGDVLAGYASDKLVAYPEPMGPSSVMRYHRSPEIRDFAQKLTEAFGISGMLNLECIVDRRSGEPYLLEINRRFSPGAYRGAMLNVDMCAALHAALHGLPSPSRADLDDGEQGVRVNFPYEWLRDPHSRWLREYPVDVPWDEPELIAAMLAMRHDR
jgi:hypothetical protein